MKIGFIFSTWSTGNRPLDFNNLFTSSRGLTGSDLGIVMVAAEFAKLGNDVSLFTSHIENKPSSWKNVKLFNIEECNKDNTSNFDVLISWSDPSPFMNTSDKPLRLVYQMLNDFTYCYPGFDNYVDHWITVCDMLKEHLVKQNNAPPLNKWSVVPLGCDPLLYTDARVPGRVIWASSADRGLHWLLQEWPKIKKAVPNAHLKIFYNFSYGPINQIEPDSVTEHPHVIEMAQRIRYMEDSIKKLKYLDVEHVGSISREQMAKEMSEASVLAFPVDTVAFTEGFSVTTLEGLASHTVPVITDKDCLGSIYNDSGAIVIKSPIREHLSEFTTSIIKSLTDKQFADNVINKCSIFANTHTWTNTAKKIENMIINHPKYNGIKPMEISINNIVKLNICCGPNVFPHEGWINYDREDFEFYFKDMIQTINMTGMPEHQKNLVKFLQSGGVVNFSKHDVRNKFIQHQNNTVDLIYVGQAIEHINPIYETPQFIDECFRMLKPGGILRMTTPDLDLLINAYKNNDMDKFSIEQPAFYKNADSSAQLSYLMYGAGGPNSSWDNYEGHMHLYTQKSMTAILQLAGFKDIKFYYEAGKSRSDLMSKECVDAGMTHSFAVEAVK